MCRITEEMMGKPIGMFHCPINGRMVMPSKKCMHEDNCEDKLKPS